LVAVRGEVARAGVVEIENPEGKTIARGICRFSLEELAQVQGKNNLEILTLYPGRTRAEVVHRDHLAPLI
jgi:glutamate 5-kinase